MISLSAGDQERLREICGRHGVRLLVVFGSQVTGRVHAASDLDLGVLVTRHAADGMSLWGDLQGLFPRQDVDVVWLHRADPLLLHHVLRHPQLLFGDRETLLRYQVYAWKRFVEYQPFFAREAEAVRKGIQRLRRAG